MPNKTIVKAIESATRDVDQSADVAKQLISWRGELAQGSESLEDLEKISSRCEFLFRSVNLGDEEDE